MKKLSHLAALCLLALSLPTHAALIAVNWAADSNPDGLGSGTLGGLGVNLVSTDGAVNGGDTFSGNWAGQAGTDGVPGIAAIAGANRNAIDWNAGAAGSATITFSGGTVTNPILLFDFTDPGETFDFANALTLNILDQSPGGSVTIAAGNVVTINNAPSNTANDGFALQLIGTFSSIAFNTNLSQLSSQSVGFSIAADAANVTVNRIPAPGSLALMLLGLVGCGFARCRNR